MKIIGVIPSRYASVRLPGKPLSLIKGKPMIVRVYEQALKSKLLDKVIVATDDKRIEECVNSYGGIAILTSAKHQSGSDRICEAAAKINCNIVVNIQGDEPFIDPENIDRAVRPLIDDRKLNVSTLAVRIKDKSDLSNINKVKVVLDKDGYALYFSRSCIPYYLNQTVKKSKGITETAYYKHIGLYVFRKKFLLAFCKMKKGKLEEAEKLEQLRILENHEKIKVIITNKDSFSVDTEEDLNLANKID
ncbi:MAG: 3-deoxy-manno-octulosonate cytidylyltransferase [Ignavibacteria bacterium]|nr:3-deoxy-manno-octulosonate cytidylyltransferase [Ignavibacteria bacterium]